MSNDRPSALVRATLALEHTDALDQVADKLHPLAHKLVANPTARHALHGRPMGHALHPVLTDVPIGAWLSTAVLDVVGGPSTRPAARTLVGFGILSAVPTAVAGLAEWAETDGVNRRVGLVHAGANNVGLCLYTASWLTRRSGHHRAGAVLGMTGLAVVGVGGFLGAHLSLARKVATRHEAFADDDADDAGSAADQGTADQTVTEPGDLAAGGTA